MGTGRRTAGVVLPPRSRAVVPLHGAPDVADLRASYDRYRSVSGGLAPDLISTPEMIAARVALTKLLLEDGWDAPAPVLERLEQDEALLGPRLLVAS